MKSYKPIFMAALLAVWALALPGAAKGQEADVAAMMAEIGQLTAEKEKNNEQIKIDLQTVQEASREDVGKQAEAAQAKAELARLQSQGAALIGQYGGSVSKKEVTCKKSAACESTRLAINAEIAANAAKLTAARAGSTARAEKAQSVSDKQRRNREIDRRIALLKQQIAFTKANASGSCRSECTGLANSDSVAQCMQACWDRARQHTSLPTVEQVGGATPVVVPPQTGPRRTAEQAIKEYKDSGAERPGPSFRMRDVPPPKF